MFKLSARAGSYGSECIAISRFAVKVGCLGVIIIWYAHCFLVGLVGGSVLESQHESLSYFFDFCIFLEIVHIMHTVKIQTT